MISPNSSIPEVTIGLPVYNGAQWLEQAIESLLAQDYENFKIIISDDCSDDETPDICSSYSDQYNNIDFSVNKKNLGGDRNLIKILSNCESDYFVWASQDDYWHKDFLSTLVSKLEEDNKLVLASGNVEIIRMDESSYVLDFLGYWNPENLNQYLLVAALLLPVSYGNWLKTNLFIHGVIRTSVLKKSFDLLVDEVCQDRTYILFTILQGRWGYVDKLLYYRRAGTGELVRDSQEFNIIQEKTKSHLTILADAWLMTIGVWKIENVNILIKLNTYFMIVLYIFSMYTKKIKRRLLGTNVLKRMLPNSLYNRIRLVINK